MTEDKSQGTSRHERKIKYRGKTNKHRNRASSRNGRIKTNGNSLKVHGCPFCYHGLSIRLEHKKETKRELQSVHGNNKYVL